jgi:LytS/YehU family sensor histidine kinase
MGFVNVNYILEDWKKSLIKTETLEKENIRAKLEALQTQLSPHFLFNNFNIIDALIETEPKLARKYVQGLSTVFRYILDNKNKELIALKEELQFIKEFMFLIETRFDKNVSLEVNIEGSTYKKMVPPMSLQLLIENAIKHNEISNRNKLEIVIQEMANKYLSIPNNVKLRKGKFSNTGTGLKKHR